MAITHINLNTCTRCEMCYKICPTDVFRLNERGYPVVAYLEDCMSCFLCDEVCPPTCITVTGDRAAEAPFPW